MRNVYTLSIASTFALALSFGCTEPGPASQAESHAMYNGEAARFLTGAMAAGTADGSYTYTVPAAANAAPREITVGISTSTLLAGTPAAVFEIENDAHWCTRASPSVAVSKSIWCESCNRNDAEDCAREWAGITAGDFCEGQLDEADGPDACEPALYDDGICVDTTSSGVVTSCQHGSDTACGTWPFRHAKWRVTYNKTGFCGFSCKEHL